MFVLCSRESRARFVGTSYNTLMEMQPSPLPATTLHSLCSTGVYQGKIIALSTVLTLTAEIHRFCELFLPGQRTSCFPPPSLHSTNAINSIFQMFLSQRCSGGWLCPGCCLCPSRPQLCLKSGSSRRPLHPPWGLHQGKRSASDGKPSPPPAMASLHLAVLVFTQRQEALKRPKEKCLHWKRGRSSSLHQLESAQSDVATLPEGKGASFP